MAVAEYPPEALALEEEPAIQVGRRVERNPRRRGGQPGPFGTQGTVIGVAQGGAEVISLEPRVATADRDVDPVCGTERRDPDRRRAVRGHHDGSQERDVLERGRARRTHQRLAGLGMASMPSTAGNSVSPSSRWS